MGRLYILFLLLGCVDCSRALTSKTANDNEFEGLGEVSASMETKHRRRHSISRVQQSTARVRLQNIRSGRFLYVRSQFQNHGDSVYTVNSTDLGSEFNINIDLFWGGFLTSLRSGNVLQIVETDTGGQVVQRTMPTSFPPEEPCIGQPLSTILRCTIERDGSLWSSVEPEYEENHLILPDILTFRNARTDRHSFGQGHYLHVHYDHQSEWDPVVHHSHNSEGSKWKVWPISTGTPAPIQVEGRWEPLRFVASGGSILTKREGTTSSGSQSTSHTFRSEVSESVVAGFEIQGAAGMDVSATRTLREETSQSIRRQHSTAQTYERTHEFKREEGGEYLWQWVFDYTRDGETLGETRSRYYALTVGRWELPACLPGFCKRPGCKRCETEGSEIIYTDH